MVGVAESSRRRKNLTPECERFRYEEDSEPQRQRLLAFLVVEKLIDDGSQSGASLLI
jgi:hypothetical protein